MVFTKFNSLLLSFLSYMVQDYMSYEDRVNWFGGCETYKDVCKCYSAEDIIMRVFTYCKSRGLLEERVAQWV